MKKSIWVTVCVVSLLASAAGAESAVDGRWVGVWRAEMNGQLTAGTLTLAADTGDLGGTVVLDTVRDKHGKPQEIAIDPHVLISPLTSGNTLSFHVKMKRLDGSIFAPEFLVTLTSPDKANMRCLNCGAGAPLVPFVRTSSIDGGGR
jgi:hypothetical protein